MKTKNFKLISEHTTDSLSKSCKLTYRIYRDEYYDEFVQLIGVEQIRQPNIKGTGTNNDKLYPIDNIISENINKQPSKKIQLDYAYNIEGKSVKPNNGDNSFKGYLKAILIDIKRRKDQS